MILELDMDPILEQFQSVASFSVSLRSGCGGGTTLPGPLWRGSVQGDSGLRGLL